jgi:uncharacterized membrane protein YkvA (DUF1232 family)
VEDEMDISEVRVGLKGKDLLGIINEFVKIEGLTISKIDIKEDIIIKGTFKKIITLDFLGRVKLKRVSNGIIEGELLEFKISKLRIISFVRKAALKFVLNSIDDIGIKYNDGKVLIDLRGLLKDVPFVDFDIININVNKDTLYVDANNIKISLEGTLKKETSLEKVKEKETSNEDINEALVENIKKIEDNYTKGRTHIENKLPEKVRAFKDYLFVIPDMVALIYRLLKDKRVPIKTKLVISAAVSYVAFPTDLIPDNIPFIGNIDELAVIFFALDRIIEDVPISVILENWQGKNDIILVIKKILDYAVNFTGARNVEKIYNFIGEVATI